MERADVYKQCRINIADSLHTGFVTPAEVSADLDGIMEWIKTRHRADVDLNEIESKLRASDKIERVNVCVLNDGTLNIDIVPMVPVARVFDGNASYYINNVGKRISASPRYHIDVPVVVGHFSARYPAARLLPLLDYIAADQGLDALVSTVKQERNGNITIIPSIRGHVINFGDTSMLADKFARLRTFYREVMPVRGWETYDTLAVKWRGRIVATRRNKALGQSLLVANNEEFDDIDDMETMISPLHTDTVGPDTI
jgi:cell division protein FtsQ